MQLTAPEHPATADPQHESETHIMDPGPEIPAATVTEHHQQVWRETTLERNVLTERISPTWPPNETAQRLWCIDRALQRVTIGKLDDPAVFTLAEQIRAYVNDGTVPAHE